MIDLTFGQFMEMTAPYIKEVIGEAVSHLQSSKEHEFAYGLDGIAKLVGGSLSKATRLKRSGVIDDAICQDGRRFSVDITLARELIKANSQKMTNHNNLSFRHKN